MVQDLVEYENIDGTPSPTGEEQSWSDASATRPTVTQDDIGTRTPPRKNKTGSVAGYCPLFTIHNINSYVECVLEFCRY